MKNRTLQRRVRCCKSRASGHDDSGNTSDDIEVTTLNVTGRKKYNGRQVFSDIEELCFKDYLIKSSRPHIRTRKIAFEYA